MFSDRETGCETIYRNIIGCFQHMDLTSSSSVEREDPELEDAECEFLEAALLEAKVRNEIEKKREVMKLAISEAIEVVNKASLKTEKLEAEKIRLQIDANSEDIFDRQLAVSEVLLCDAASQMWINNLEGASRTSLASMRMTGVTMPSCQLDQEKLQSQFKEVDSLLLADGLLQEIDAEDACSASHAAQDIESCLKLEINALTEMKLLAEDIKALAEENALLISSVTTNHRASLG